MDEQKKIKIRIAGVEYTLLSEDPEAEVLALAAKLDEDLHAGMEQGMSLTAALVLTALNYLDESKKNAATADKMREQVTQYATDSIKLRITMDEMKREIRRLQAEKKTAGQGENE